MTEPKSAKFVYFLLQSSDLCLFSFDQLGLLIITNTVKRPLKGIQLIVRKAAKKCPELHPVHAAQALTDRLEFLPPFDARLRMSTASGRSSKAFLTSRPLSSR